MDSLRNILRRAVLAIADTDVDGSQSHVNEVRLALQERGLEAGCHVGNPGLGTGTDLCVEWYAGQLVEIFNNESYFAVNSFINCLDLFCPEIAPE